EPTPTPSALPRTLTPTVQQSTTPLASPTVANTANNGSIAIVLGAGGLLVLLMLMFRKKPTSTDS
ncbi:MAG TPA: hypothetical protein PK530_04275, partial [Anaerolineales bacterium]|nr:hypothetical protein [Anaerolineales bacterium]